MAEKCTCGAQPPEDARFCHKCGRPLYDYVPAEIEEAPAPPPVAPPPPQSQVSFRSGTAIRIALLTAVLMVLLNLFPLEPSLAVLRLLALLFAGGVFAVWVWMRRTRQTISVQEGARLGWIAGVFAFVLFTGLLTMILLAATTPGAIDQLKQQMPNNAETQASLQFLQNPTVGGILAGLIGLFVLVTALPTIGGALSARLLNRDAQYPKPH